MSLRVSLREWPFTGSLITTSTIKAGMPRGSISVMKYTHCVILVSWVVCRKPPATRWRARFVYFVFEQSYVRRRAHTEPHANTACKHLVAKEGCNLRCSAAVPEEKGTMLSHGRQVLNCARRHLCGAPAWLLCWNER